MVLNNKLFSTKKTSEKILTARGAKILFFFEKSKERKALRPLRNTDKEMKIIALFAVNKRVR
jgi:hypothetical protein